MTRAHKRCRLSRIGYLTEVSRTNMVPYLSIIYMLPITLFTEYDMLIICGLHSVYEATFLVVVF